jgi:DNA-binding Xre family transcriptional regulator
MLSLEEIVVILQDRNLSEVSKRTGISYQVIWRIANNKAGNFTYNTVKKLSDYLEVK